MVSIHAPARGATDQGDGLTARGKGFQSTRPRGARRVAGRHPPVYSAFQSTRPRGARHGRRQRVYAIGAFQSTRPRGARPPACHATPTGGCFNPRAREGRDFDLLDLILRYQVVSIHAPARGATKQEKQNIVSKLFQSTRPRGARRGKSVDRVSYVTFQSTRPRGARPATLKRSWIS